MLEACVEGQLGRGQVDQGPQRRLRVPRREEPGGAVHHVAGPHQVVTPELLVALGIPPRDAERGDHRTGEVLVFVRQEQAVAGVVERAVVLGRRVQRRDVLARAGPLPLEPGPPVLEREAERLEEVRHGRVEGVAERERQRELGPVRQVQLARQRDVAVLRRVVLPVHVEIVRQVRPPVRSSNVAAGATQERPCGTQGEPRVGLVGHQDLPAVHLRRVAVVPPSPDFEVRREQHEQSKAAEERLIRGQPGPDEHAGRIWGRSMVG